MSEYEGARRLVYGEDRATFVPVCEKCGRFVSGNEVVMVSDATGLSAAPNAICSKCGPTRMLFEGFL